MVKMPDDSDDVEQYILEEEFRKSEQEKLGLKQELNQLKSKAPQRGRSEAADISVLKEMLADLEDLQDRMKDLGGKPPSLDPVRDAMNSLEDADEE
jgi:hypothetical protein